MTRTQAIGVGVGAVVVVGLVLVAVERTAARKRADPSWLNVDQPAPSVAAQLPTITAAELAATWGTPSMTACCDGLGAGRNIMRTYPGTLADSDASLVRGRADLLGRC